MNIASLQSSATVNEAAALKEEGRQRHTPTPQENTEIQLEGPGEGQPEGLDPRLSLHHHLGQQAPSSPSEGGMQP